LSKHDLRWEAAGPASAAELPPALARSGALSKDHALVRFLSAADDWQVAGKQLSGAFCDDQAICFRTGKKE
jgi:hypothetical protein